MQEVMTKELAAKVAAYDQSVAHWRSSRAQRTHGAIYCALIAVPMWFLSYHVSAWSGPVNQTAWLTFFAMVTFAAAGILSAGALGLGVYRYMDSKPVREFDLIRLVGGSPDNQS